jgi:hypothetical protein
VPWFDAAHHDRFVLHGAGYESRYLGGLDPRLHGIYSDDYITTEMLTGHPAMVPRPFDRQVVRKYWLTRDAMRGLAQQTITNVEFVDGDMHRQHVTWSGDAHVWVNRGTQDWTVDGTVLPPYGFLARVPLANGVIVAAIERRDGVIVESSRSPGQYYVNARGQMDDNLPVSLSIEQVTYRGDRKLELQLRWKGISAIPRGFVPFLHFVDAKGEIAFQGSQPPLEQLKVDGETHIGTAIAMLPDSVRPGDAFELCYGLYHTRNSRRLPLAGSDRGDRRIRLGNLAVVGSDTKVEQVTWQSIGNQPDPYLERQNPDRRAIAFPEITTSGACRLTWDGTAVIVTLLPDTREPFEVAVSLKQLPWNGGSPRRVAALDMDGKVLSMAPAKTRDGITTFLCSPHVFQHRIEAE